MGAPGHAATSDVFRTGDVKHYIVYCNYGCLQFVSLVFIAENCFEAYFCIKRYISKSSLFCSRRIRKHMAYILPVPSATSEAILGLLQPKNSFSITVSLLLLPSRSLCFILAGNVDTMSSMDSIPLSWMSQLWLARSFWMAETSFSLAARRRGDSQILKQAESKINSG